MKVELTPAEFRDLCRVIAISASDYETRKATIKAVAKEALDRLSEPPGATDLKGGR